MTMDPAVIRKVNEAKQYLKEKKDRQRKKFKFMFSSSKDKDITKRFEDDD